VRRSVSLRLHPEVMKEWPQTPTLQPVQEYSGQESAGQDEMEERLKAYREELNNEGKPWPYVFLSQLSELSRKELIAYPGHDIAYALRARRNNKSSRRNTSTPLDDHLTDVQDAAGKFAGQLPDDLKEALCDEAKFHDYGKIDVRYQAWLRGGDLMAARYAPKPVAKSGNDPVGKQESVGLPKGFRHELLSLMFAERSADVKNEMRDLILHLVASHHGRCRPFPPVVLDEGPECVSYNGISICKQERIEQAPHQLNSGIADRFWRLTRKYGWWGLAYLEAMLRLADWKASEEENAEVSG
jgi:CRISPR-associated helicase Cas3